MSFNGTKTPLKAEIKGKARYQLPMRKIRDNRAVKKHGGNANEYYFTPELEEKFRSLFPTTPNRDMMRLFGIGFSTLQCFKREMGLKKDMAVIKHKQAMAIKKKCEENGYYDSLRGKAPSQACLDGHKRKIESGWHPLRSLKEENPRRYRKLMKKRREHRIELEAEERKRMKWGLDPKTKLHRPALNFDRRQAAFRYNMKRFGYILGDMRDNSGERYTIFYDEETERHPIKESHAGTYGFRIVSLIKPKPVVKKLKAIKPKKKKENEQLQSAGV